MQIPDLYLIDFRYFDIGVPDRSYSSLIMTTPLMEKSDYKGYNQWIILNDITIKFKTRKSAEGVLVDVGNLVDPNIAYDIGYLVPYLIFCSIFGIWHPMRYWIPYFYRGRDIGDIGSIVGIQATQFGHVSRGRPGYSRYQFEEYFAG